MISEHFSLQEVSFSDTAIRLGIDNTPTEAQLEGARAAAAGMEQVRKVLDNNPIKVNSWMRCEALERVLCQADYNAWCVLHEKPITPASWKEYFERKAHPNGYAVDFTCPAFGTPKDIVLKLKKSKIKFDKLILEGTWVHVSFDPQLRGEVLTASFDSSGTPYYEKGVS